MIQFILNWLVDGSEEIPKLVDAYQLGPNELNEDKHYLFENSITHAMKWFVDANILLDEGREGVYEGLGTEIGGAGEQRVSTIIRTDCVGEVSQAYLFHYLWTQNKESLNISNHLANFIFDQMQIKDEGHLHGMVRWTNEAWEVCYQDDVARAIIPELLKALYMNERKHLQSCVDALQFLVNTTGTDGTRGPRTDNIDLNEEEIKRLKNQPGNYPSAHYNAYYHAALLLAYKLTDIDEFKEVAVKGLETIMGVYPNTLREHSQTQELCRLVLPLSWLYWVTKDQKHLDWLYEVCRDLEQFKHESGAFIEWDDGYKANMRNPIGEGESSLLTQNGIPVVDMLYSNNWLPMGFLQANLITDDDYFKTLWNDTAQYMIRSQIFSSNKQINGSWARSIDVEKMEVYGSPADVGWGPWAVESGWMQAQIVSGLMGGLMLERLKPYYRD